MKNILRLTIILAVTFAGEFLAVFIPLPVPAGIYGMILLFLCLALKIIPLEAVRTPGKFLIDIMPVMFIPAAVGLIDNTDALKAMLLPCLIALLPVTFIVMTVSGHVTQKILCQTKKEDGRHA